MESGTKPKMNPGNEWYYGEDAAGVARPIYRLAGWTEQMAEAKLMRDTEEAEQQRAFKLEREAKSSALTEQRAEAKLKHDADEAERDAQRKAVQLEQQRAFQLEQ